MEKQWKGEGKPGAPPGEDSRPLALYGAMYDATSPAGTRCLHDADDGDHQCEPVDNPITLEALISSTRTTAIIRRSGAKVWDGRLQGGAWFARSLIVGLSPFGRSHSHFYFKRYPCHGFPLLLVLLSKLHHVCIQTGPLNTYPRHFQPVPKPPKLTQVDLLCRRDFAWTARSVEGNPRLSSARFVGFGP